MNVSICMATYNGEKYIKEQLESIINQIDKNDEIIISDDSSTDNTVEIIKEINDDRIRLYENNKFRNPISNFENALKKVNNELIFLCDQDDIWENNKVDIMKKELMNYDLVVSDCKVVDSNLNTIEDSFFHLRNSGKGFAKNLYKNTYLGCCMAFNKKILEKALPFPKNIPMHDIWLGMIGESFGNTVFIENKLIKYRRHGNNASPTAEKSRYSIYNKMRFRINILTSLILRKLKWR